MLNFYQIVKENLSFNRFQFRETVRLEYTCPIDAEQRDFQQQFNETPGKWLQKRRVHHAARLIANSNLSVTQIAFESGFEDLSHFSRAFKKNNGRLSF